MSISCELMPFQVYTSYSFGVGQDMGSNGVSPRSLLMVSLDTVALQSNSPIIRLHDHIEIDRVNSFVLR